MPANVAAQYIIKTPLLSEKNTFAMEQGKKYTFLVDPRATKTEIKDAIQEIYKVRVESVNTQLRKGKFRRTKFGLTTESNTKKAIVTLHADDSIELF
jgi:large subunit ribosomal protein L23